jgi:nucleotide-binding universal stress UspA family protein
MTDKQPRIVVGVDGSADSRTAVRWADEQARVTGATVTLVTVWHVPAYFGSPMAMMPLADLDLEADARAIAEKAAAELHLPADRVEIRVTQGAAGPALVKSAEDADLLVVGSRGHNPIGGVLLGSVSAYCVHHAEVPVVIVR